MTTIIKDCIYRYITVPQLCQTFIDTPEFQRLRRVKQLGTVHYVYPSAVHTRFEHSLGVMHLAGLAVDSITDGKADPHIKELIMLAGLLHDVGHMAFSHMFDEVAKDVEGIANSHEERAVELLKAMNNRKGNVLSVVDLERVNCMILGLYYYKDDPKWIYQIVNNKICDIDVDKLDYLQRDAYHTGIPGLQPDYVIRQMVCDDSGNLAFRSKAQPDLEHIFVTRKRMFASVYYHKTGAKIDAIYCKLIKDAVLRLNSYYHFEDDLKAETYLRKEYSRIFELIDLRQLDAAIELSGAKVPASKTPSYISGCDDLQEIMSKIIFI